MMTNSWSRRRVNSTRRIPVTALNGPTRCANATGLGQPFVQGPVERIDVAGLELDQLDEFHCCLPDEPLMPDHTHSMRLSSRGGHIRTGLCALRDRYCHAR